MGGGCGGFSLLGLLIGVGLTVWLASMVVDGSFGGDSPERGNAETLASVVDPPTSAVADPVAITVAPATDLVDGAEVTITSDAFPAGAQVRIETCLTRSKVVTGEASPCDPTATALDVVDPRGHLVVRYPVARVVDVGGTPFDCAGEPARCVVAVTDVADATRTGSAPITFRPQTRGPEITLPD